MTAEKVSLRSYLREEYGKPTQLLVRDYERDLHKKARYNNHHIFSLRCRDEGIIPTSLRITSPVKTKQGFRIAARASRAFLLKRIHETQRKRCEISARIDEAHSRMAEKMSENDLDRVTALCKGAAEKTFAKTRQIHLKKLQKLSKKKKVVSLRPEGLEKWIVNRTNATLTKQQQEVLELGLNFAPTPNKIPIKDIAAAVEEATPKLSADDASDLRLRVCGVLRKANPPEDNLTGRQRRALKELREMKDVVILPADKGNATVLLMREEYSTKMRNMLATPTYKELKKDPTAAQEAKVEEYSGDWSEWERLATPFTTS